LDSWFAVIYICIKLGKNGLKVETFVAIQSFNKVYLFITTCAVALLVPLMAKCSSRQWHVANTEFYEIHCFP
jgi:hypothetical protein